MEGKYLAPLPAAGTDWQPPGGDLPGGVPQDAAAETPLVPPPPAAESVVSKSLTFEPGTGNEEETIAEVTADSWEARREELEKVRRPGILTLISAKLRGPSRRQRAAPRWPAGLVPPLAASSPPRNGGSSSSA
jgi:hypothetical protein